MYLPDRRDQLECPGDCILRCALDRLFSFLFSFPSLPFRHMHMHAQSVSHLLPASSLPCRSACCSAAAVLMMMMLLLMLLLLPGAADDDDANDVTR